MSDGEHGPYFESWAFFEPLTDLDRYGMIGLRCATIARAKAARKVLNIEQLKPDERLGSAG